MARHESCGEGGDAGQWTARTAKDCERDRDKQYNGKVALDAAVWSHHRPDKQSGRQDQRNIDDTASQRIPQRKLGRSFQSRVDGEGQLRR
jgi:hypothetical protein